MLPLLHRPILFPPMTPYSRQLSWIAQDRGPCTQFSGWNLDSRGPRGHATHAAPPRQHLGGHSRGPGGAVGAREE